MLGLRPEWRRAGQKRLAVCREVKLATFATWPAIGSDEASPLQEPQGPEQPGGLQVKPFGHGGDRAVAARADANQNGELGDLQTDRTKACVVDPRDGASGHPRAVAKAGRLHGVRRECHDGPRIESCTYRISDNGEPQTPSVHRSVRLDATAPWFR
jgi:hypothetical protein